MPKNTAARAKRRDSDGDQPKPQGRAVLKPLTALQQRFLKAYGETGNLAEAAKRAGSKAKSREQLRKVGWQMKERIRKDPRKAEAFREAIQEYGFTADNWAELTMQALTRPEYITVRQASGQPDIVVALPPDPIAFAKTCEMIRQFTGLGVGGREPDRDLFPEVGDDELCRRLGLSFRGEPIPAPEARSDAPERAEVG